MTLETKVPIGVYAMLFTQTMDALATMVVLPTMPFYAMYLGADAFAIAMLGSVCNFSQMWCSPALGALSDKVGRKSVMLTGLAGQAFCNILMGETASIQSLLLVRGLAGMALSIGPAEMAYIMDATHSEADLSHVLALQRVTTSAGALVGPLVASALDKYPFQFLCRGLACINVLNFVIGLVLWSDVPRKDAISDSDGSDGTPTFQENSLGCFLSSMRSLATNISTAALLLVTWIYTLGFGVGDGPEVVFFKEHFGYGKDQVCYFFVATNLASLVFASVVPKIIQYLGPRATCKAGCLGVACCLLLLIVCVGEPLVPYICGMFEVGLFGGMIGLSFMHLVRQSCPEALMGTMLGLQSCLSGFAGTIGPPAGGLLYQWNPFLPVVCSMLFSAMAAGLYSALPPMRPDDARPSIPQRAGARPKLKRVSTFGQSLYADKSFINQVHSQCLRLNMDPELYQLYQVYRDRLNKDRGGETSPQSIPRMATVPGDLVVAHASMLQQAHHSRGLRRPASNVSDTVQRLLTQHGGEDLGEV